MLSSDYSQQEPKLTAYISQDPNMIKAFQEGKDIYATIASLAFNLPYEKCLEFHPQTHEFQAEGKARRSEAKTIVLGEPKGQRSKTNAPSVEAIVHRLLRVNFVNCITRRCIAHA